MSICNRPRVGLAKGVVIYCRQATLRCALRIVLIFYDLLICFSGYRIFPFEHDNSFQDLTSGFWCHQRFMRHSFLYGLNSTLAAAFNFVFISFKNLADIFPCSIYLGLFCLVFRFCYLGLHCFVFFVGFELLIGCFVFCFMFLILSLVSCHPRSMQVILYRIFPKESALCNATTSALLHIQSL